MQGCIVCDCGHAHWHISWIYLILNCIWKSLVWWNETWARNDIFSWVNECDETVRMHKLRIVFYVIVNVHWEYIYIYEKLTFWLVM